MISLLFFCGEGEDVWDWDSKARKLAGDINKKFD